MCHYTSGKFQKIPELRSNPGILICHNPFGYECPIERADMGCCLCKIRRRSLRKTARRSEQKARLPGKDLAENASKLSRTATAIAVDAKTRRCRKGRCADHGNTHYAKVSDIPDLAPEMLVSSRRPPLGNKFARRFVPSFNFVSLNPPSVARIRLLRRDNEVRGVNVPVLRRIKIFMAE